MNYIYLVIKQTHDMKKVSLLALLAILFFSCSKEELKMPEIQPVPPTELSVEVFPGNVIKLEWVDNSTNEEGFKIERKSLNGAYSIIKTLGSNITSFEDRDLSFNVDYSYRVYSFNKAGGSLIYSNEIKTNTFPTVQIGNQVWTSMNLSVSNYQDGTPIPEMKNEKEWINAYTNKIGAWCWTEYDSTKNWKKGKLYNWYAIKGSKRIGPLGFVIPFYSDWEKLIGDLGGGKAAFNSLRSKTDWPSGGGDNSSGFNAKPTGESFCYYPSTIGPAPTYTTTYSNTPIFLNKYSLIGTSTYWSLTTQKVAQPKNAWTTSHRNFAINYNNDLYRGTTTDGIVLESSAGVNSRDPFGGGFAVRMLKLY